MRKLDGEQVLMRIFVGESDAVAGFGANSVVHTANILRLSADLPLVIEVVDSQERLEAVLPEVDGMMRGGLITMEKVRVLKYDQTPTG